MAASAIFKNVVNANAIKSVLERDARRPTKQLRIELPQGFLHAS